MEPSLSAATDPVLEEAALLARARRAIDTDPRAALAAVQVHEQRFAHGELIEEREAIAIEALMRTGQASLAATRARHFLAQFPGSAYRGRVHDALAPSSASPAHEVNP